MLIRACPTCGLAQEAPEERPGFRTCCCRCGTTLARASARFRSAQRTVALAVAALLIYPLAIGLPIIEIQELGLRREASVIDGIISLFGDGQLLVGSVVLLCSVIIPLSKLGALMLLSTGGRILAKRHRAITYHLVEWTGRWGMLDVLLVAILVALVKLGDLVEVSAGPGAIAFSALVVLSLIATAAFDPHHLWRGDEA